MDPLAANQSHVQQNSGPAAPAPGYVEDAGTADELALLALFSDAVAITEQADLEAMNLVDISTEVNSCALKEIRSATMKNQHATDESHQANEVVRQSSREVIQVAAEAHAFQGIQDLFVVGGKGTDQIHDMKPAGHHSGEDLAAAVRQGRVLHPKGNIVAMHPSSGYQPGDEITVRDHNGKVHKFTVRHFSDAELASIGDIVKAHIASMPQKDKDKAEEERGHRAENGPQRPKVDISRGAHRAERSKQTKEKKARGKAQLEPVASKDVQETTNAVVESSRKQVRDALRLSQLIAKREIWDADDSQKADSLGFEHRQVVPISRSYLNQVKQQS